MKNVMIYLSGAAMALGLAPFAPAQGDLYRLTPPPVLEGLFGHSVSGAGDIHADGCPDLVVGAPGADVHGPESGVITVYSGLDGNPGLFLLGDTDWDQLGWSVSDVGDANGDGFADIVAGAPCYSPDTSLGYARLFSGSSGVTLHTWYATSLYDWFGISVSGAGDFNNDGFPDVLVGASEEDNGGLIDSGSAQVFSLQAGLLYTFDGHAAGDKSGYSVSDAGDVNNDGFPDIVVGAPYDDTGGTAAGSAEVLSGKDGASLYRFQGPAGGRLGQCVSDAGDVNADGYADIIAGGDQGAAQSYTYARVYSGIDGTIIQSFGQSGASEGGRAVSGAGDIDQDGFADLLLPRPPYGGVVARSGKDGAEIFLLDGETSSDHFGRSLSDADDVNGDGIPEVIVSGGLYAKVISTVCGTTGVVGQGCPGSAPAAPTLEITGCAVPGATLFVALYALRVTHISIAARVTWTPEGKGKGPESSP
ncbi:MAG: FG-GAP repeat protein [Planctomycetes bacterium]|nr:FG-GAP repeat protein [Planctomycetota bacterium]